jgi:4-amino-4-deoxy-L-arabinose transferase-like glycosyltransferase
MTWRRVVLLALVMATLSFPLGAARKLWVLDEARYAAVVEDMHETGRWFAPQLNGEFFDHKPPLYFWLVGAVTALTGGQSEFILYTIAWFLSLACVVATYFLARALLPERAAWLAAVVMSSSFLYLITTGIARMDLMMVALMVLGLLAFVRGYTTGRRRLYVWFFVFCALAVMTKGPYGIVLPLVGVLVFLAWEKRLGEAVTPWFLGGFLVGLAILAAWLAALCFVEGPHVLRLYLVKQTLGRAASSWAHAEPFWYYAALLPLEFLPWVAFVPCGFAVMRRRHPVAFRFLLAVAASNFVVLSAVSCKIFVYILPIWPALAAAAAVRLRQASDNGASTWFRTEVTIGGVLLAALGAAGLVFCRRHFPEKAAQMAVMAAALGVLGLVALVAAWLPARAVRRRAVLVGSILVVTGLVFSRVAALGLTPAFNDVMSPKVAGEQMRGYASEGYALATCGVPIGTYNFYARQLVIRDVAASDVVRFLAENARAVVTIRGTSLDEIRAALPPGVQIGPEHILESKPHYLLVKD